MATLEGPYFGYEQVRREAVSATVDDEPINKIQALDLRTRNELTIAKHLRSQAGWQELYALPSEEGAAELHTQGESMFMTYERDAESSGEYVLLTVPAHALAEPYSVAALLREAPPTRRFAVLCECLEQMLDALEGLVHRGVVHLDIHERQFAISPVAGGPQLMNFGSAIMPGLTPTAIAQRLLRDRPPGLWPVELAAFQKASGTLSAEDASAVAESHVQTLASAGLEASETSSQLSARLVGQTQDALRGMALGTWQTWDLHAVSHMFARYASALLESLKEGDPQIAPTLALRTILAQNLESRGERRMGIRGTRAALAAIR